MATLQWRDNTNAVAYLTKHPRYPQFDAAIDLISDSQFMPWLLTNPTIYSQPILQFWQTALVVDHSIRAHVADRDIMVSEHVIRTAFGVDDITGLDHFNPNRTRLSLQQIYPGLELQDGQSLVPLQKRRFQPLWRFVVETIMRSLSKKSAGWDELSVNLQSILHAFITGEQFNFSRWLFNQLVEYTVNRRKKYVVFPRFLTVILMHMLGSQFPTNGAIKVQTGLTDHSFGLLSRSEQGDIVPPPEARARYLSALANLPHDAPTVQEEAQPSQMLVDQPSPYIPQSTAVTITPSHTVIVSEVVSTSLSFLDLLQDFPTSSAPTAKRQRTDDTGPSVSRDFDIPVFTAPATESTTPPTIPHATSDVGASSSPTMESRISALEQQMISMIEMQKINCSGSSITRCSSSYGDRQQSYI